MEYEKYPCGCVLEWDGKCLELKVCRRHNEEYHKAHGIKDDN